MRGSGHGSCKMRPQVASTLLLSARRQSKLEMSSERRTLPPLKRAEAVRSPCLGWLSTDISSPNLKRIYTDPSAHQLDSMPLTPNSELDLLFHPSLVPGTVVDALSSRGLHVSPKPGPTSTFQALRDDSELPAHAALLTHHTPSSARSQIRPLSRTDYARGHLAVLADLTLAPDLGREAYEARFDLMKSKHAGSYFIVVVVDSESDTIIGTGSVLLEHKFQRNAGTMGHIEDIVVSKQAQGKKVGIQIIAALTHISESSGSYKTILDCTDSNAGGCDTLGCLRGSRTDYIASLYMSQASMRSADTSARRYRWSNM